MNSYLFLLQTEHSVYFVPEVGKVVVRSAYIKDRPVSNQNKYRLHIRRLDGNPLLTRLS